MNNSSNAFRADRLIKRRKELGIKSKDLARLCQVSDVQISRIENGERGVTIDMLVKLSSVLNVSTDWLLGLSDDDNRTEVEHWIRVIPKGSVVVDNLTE